jgi:hypothetical protein
MHAVSFPAGALSSSPAGKRMRSHSRTRANSMKDTGRVP